MKLIEILFFKKPHEFDFTTFYTIQISEENYQNKWDLPEVEVYLKFYDRSQKGLLDIILERTCSHVKPVFTKNDIQNGMRDMGGYIISIIWVGSIVSHPPGNYHKISNKLQLKVSLVYFGNFISCHFISVWWVITSTRRRLAWKWGQN